MDNAEYAGLGCEQREIFLPGMLLAMSLQNVTEPNIVLGGVLGGD